MTVSTVTNLCIVPHLNNEGTVFDIGCHVEDKHFLILIIQSGLHHGGVSDKCI